MQILLFSAFYWDGTFKALPAFACSFFLGGGVGGAGGGLNVTLSNGKLVLSQSRKIIFVSDGNCRQPAENVREDNPPAVWRKYQPFKRKPESGRETQVGVAFTGQASTQKGPSSETSR